MPEPLYEFFLTFGPRHGGDLACKGTSCSYASMHPDGYVVIVARDATEARRAAVRRYGTAWSDLYSKETFRPAFYPKGELVRFGANDDRS